MSKKTRLLLVLIVALALPLAMPFMIGNFIYVPFGFGLIYLTSGILKNGWMAYPRMTPFFVVLFLLHLVVAFSIVRGAEVMWRRFRKGNR